MMYFPAPILVDAQENLNCPYQETMYQIPKLRGNNEPITDTYHIRRIVQICFDEAMYNLREHNFKEDAAALAQATIYWLRHTGISDDVKIRPREHVRDDAGHSSSSITDKYIDIELRERHAIAKKKLINKDIKKIDNINKNVD